MLVQFRFSNFRSFRSEADLSFVAATNLKHPPGFGITRPEGSRRDLVNVIGLFGANASGKTNVIKALQFMRDAVSKSQRLWPPEGPIPVEPFRLDDASPTEPFRCQLDLIVDQVPMQYGFALGREEVSEEWLLSWPEGRRQVLLERSGPATFHFGRGLKGPNEVISRLTRGNSLFLSAAAQNNHEQLKPLYSAIVSQINFLSPEDEQARRRFTIEQMNKGQFEGITRLVQIADLGITRLDVEEEEFKITPEMRTLVESLLENKLAPAKAKEQLFGEKVFIPRIGFAHIADHAPDGVIFEEKDESRGTLAWFSLAGPILLSLEQGAVLVADELDSSLHEILQAKVIQLFNDPQCNPKGAQLLFTSQDTTTLGDALVGGTRTEEVLLRRDQVWFTEKGRDGASTLVPLTDFHVRRSENIQRWYLRGRFGAVPILDERLMPCAMASDGTKPGPGGGETA